MSPKCPKVIPKWLQVDNVRAVLASSAISFCQNSHLEFLLSHLFPVWPGGMRVALEFGQPLRLSCVDRLLKKAE